MKRLPAIMKKTRKGKWPSGFYTVQNELLFEIRDLLIEVEFNTRRAADQTLATGNLANEIAALRRAVDRMAQPTLPSPAAGPDSGGNS